MTLHEAQTAILIWLWERDHPIMDREVMEIVDPDEQWCITFAGVDWLDHEQKWIDHGEEE